MARLAIVIPAFKDMFFEKTLHSIASQTCKDFTLYIGNDCSPYDLGSIIESFKNQIKIVYTRFDCNLGSKNLVGQWERCIDMVQDEEWIWLFSDDDTMDPNCVKSFYQYLSKTPDYDLFHFNVDTIDQNGVWISSFNFPTVITSENFFYGRCKLGYHSFVVEYIFRKSHFKEMGRFENFDLGWGSDDALWIKLGRRKGIKTIETARVNWRKSQYNISPNYRDIMIVKRKFEAKIEFARWAYRQVQENRLQIENSKMKLLLSNAFFRDLAIGCENLSFKMIKQIFFRFAASLNVRSGLRKKILHLYLYKIYRHLIALLKDIIRLAKLKINNKVSTLMSYC